MLSGKLMKPSFIFSMILAAVIGFGSLIEPALAADKDRIKTITVTVEQKGRTRIPSLVAGDFLVYENGIEKEVLSAVPATNKKAPLNLAIVIQEGIPQINSEIKALKSFIRELPEGSQVMIAYINGGFIDVRQPFTDDLDRAAGRLRVVSSVTNVTTSPYIPLIDVMKRFNGFKHGRNEILFISSGFDPLVGARDLPTANIYLERAVKLAQQQNITVFSLFAPSTITRRSFIASNGQNSLNYLAEQTGGRAFLSGFSGFVTFDAPLIEFGKLLNQQYVITFKSANSGKRYSEVKVKTDYSNLKVRSVKEYKSKS